ncbi:(2Fe-2S)-binding protein [Glycomyces harbinensis]|uniref:Carbon-monoxide dehydrogenase small subunit n=1 Tax=Glycomyces harbinensis TaxID=58114 RepID=A0A1G7BNW5_9ACTN|nr:(2Fe-2S)-binding protein [Glycomyces harbinensis]SDE28861.1 carbon-monoxide dehydrogenase small subunit [Glycomyces harbinensis]
MSEGMRVRMRVDGAEIAADVDRPGESLLTSLRDRLGLTGSKNACEQGECGSCTVLLDGLPVCACLVATAQCEGREVKTVVGAVPRPVRDAFVACGAVQCGFCTPGLLVSVADLLDREPDPDDALIREALAGNLCRCTGYEKIIEAVHVAAEAMSDGVPRVPARSHLHHNQWINVTTFPRGDAETGEDTP